MKLQSIKFVKGPYDLTYPKTKNSKVFLPLQLEDEMFNQIQKEASNLEYIAKKVNSPIYFYPKKECTLMNFGPYTSVLDHNDLPENNKAKIYEHINKIYKGLEAESKSRSIYKNLVNKIFKFLK